MVEESVQHFETEKSILPKNAYKWKNKRSYQVAFSQYWAIMCQKTDNILQSLSKVQII